MAKMSLATTAVLAIALLAIAGVSGFRATVRTTINEEDQGQWGGAQQQRCRQQIQQRQQQLRECQQFLQQQSRGSPYELPMYNQQEQQQQQLRQCCQQLRNFDEECRCEAVKHVVQQLQQGQFGPEQQRQQEQIRQTARYLPQMCNLQPQECQIQTGFSY